MQILPTELLEDDVESRKLSELNEQVLKLCFPHYDFRTKVIKLNAETRSNRVINAAMTTNSATLSLVDILKGQAIERPNTPEGRQAFRLDVDDYYKRLAEAKDSQMIDLQKAILAAKKGNYNSILSQEIKFGRNSAELQHTFSRYLAPE
jgi:hypothetical protein